jgi:predicted DNA-binding protein (MmcQ/YjbR family)
MSPEELRAWCLAMPGAVEEFPFGADLSVFKVPGGGKIFALARLGAAPLSVSLKCEPLLGESLRASYDSVAPGYHLNKKHWLTVTLGGDAGDQMVMDLIQDSYDLVKPKRLSPPATRARRSSG